MSVTVSVDGQTSDHGVSGSRKFPKGVAGVLSPTPRDRVELQEWGRLRSVKDALRGRDVVRVGTDRRVNRVQLLVDVRIRDAVEGEISQRPLVVRSKAVQVWPEAGRVSADTRHDSWRLG